MRTRRGMTEGPMALIASRSLAATACPRSTAAAAKAARRSVTTTKLSVRKDFTGCHQPRIVAAGWGDLSVGGVTEDGIELDEHVGPGRVLPVALETRAPRERGGGGPGAVPEA